MSGQVRLFAAPQRKIASLVIAALLASTASTAYAQPPADPAPGQPSAATMNPSVSAAPASQTSAAAPSPMPGSAPFTPPPPMSSNSGDTLAGMSLQDIDSTFTTVEGITDIIGGWIGPKPPPRPEFGFADTKGFDMQLHQSLGAHLDRVNVLADGRFTSDALPQRMGNWLDQVRKTGGTVGECVIRPEGSRGILFFLQLALRVLQAIDTWQLYQPAKNYNAVVLINEQGHQVRNVIFEERSKPELACPGGEKPRIMP